MEKEINPNIQKYLNNNEMELMKFKGINPIQEVRAAYLKKTESYRAKDFTFDFNESTTYYFFITKRANPNYLQPLTKEQSLPFKSSEDHSQKGITFNFDYNRYLLQGIIAKKNPKNNNLDVWLTINLNREICQITHTTKDAIQYYRLTKTIKPEKSKKNFENFPLGLERYYMVEIETKKPLCDTNIKEDGILSVVYLITPEKDQITDLFTMVKYTVYFIKETLSNYIGKYIRDMIFDFCHLPSDCLSDFLAHLGALCKRNKKQSNKSKIIFPLKKYIKSLQNLSQRNLIRYMNKNLPNIIRAKAADRVPFHKFIQMYEKYNIFYAEKEFKIKQKAANEPKNKFLKSSLVNVPGVEKMTNVHTVNLKNTLSFFFETLNEFFREKLSTDNKLIYRFMLDSLSRYLNQYTSFKGFFNLDIVMNEDSMFEFNCCNNKKMNKWVNTKAFRCISGTLNCMNYFFEFNEGFFHKHFSIMDYSYNFNEKNVIHTFPCAHDSSKKNKIRIFDIPFIEKWAFHVASLILLVYRDSFGFLKDLLIINDSSKEDKSEENFLHYFSIINEKIADEFFETYESVLPDYYTFCSRISRFPLDKYNCLDNLCQHFTNNSIQSLTKNNIIFFSPYDIVYNLSMKQRFNHPNLNCILEPYLILVDENLKNYIDKKEKKEKYLEERNIDIKNYYLQLKNINLEKVHYSLFLTDNNVNEDSEGAKLYEKNMESLPESKAEKCQYDFYFLNNLSFFFTYKTMQEMKGRFINYDIVKRYIASAESSVTISFHDYDKTILQNTPRDINTIKKTKKDVKKNIIKDLIIMNKIQTMTRHMTYIFAQYVKSVIDEIIRTNHGNILTDEPEEKSKIVKKDEKEEKCFIKIGHYLINFALYEHHDNDINSFLESELSKEIYSS